MDARKLHARGIQVGSKVLTEMLKDLESGRLGAVEFEALMASIIGTLLTGTASCIYSQRKYSEDVEKWSVLLGQITNDLFESFARDVSGLNIKVRVSEPLLTIKLLGEAGPRSSK